MSKKSEEVRNDVVGIYDNEITAKVYVIYQERVTDLVIGGILHKNAVKENLMNKVHTNARGGIELPAYRIAKVCLNKLFIPTYSHKPIYTD